MDELKPAKKRGPAPTGRNGRVLGLYLTDADIERARAIGKGNVSAGVREALRRAVTQAPLSTATPARRTPTPARPRMR